MWFFLLLSDRPGLAGKTTMLTYIQINAAKPREKAWNLSDSQGLYLVIQPNVRSYGASTIVFWTNRRSFISAAGQH
jgi:hypothetical protein